MGLLDMLMGGGQQQGGAAPMTAGLSDRLSNPLSQIGLAMMAASGGPKVGFAAPIAQGLANAGALQEKRREQEKANRTLEYIRQTNPELAQMVDSGLDIKDAWNITIRQNALQQAQQRDEANRQFQMSQAERQQANADRTFGLQERQEQRLSRPQPQQAPSGYRFTEGNQGMEFIPGGPADPAVSNRMKPVGGFADTQSLRKEYQGTPEAKEFADIRSSYDRIRASASNGTGVGDLGVIFGYMKMLDPGSVVREGEFATAENAQGVPQQISNLYNRIVSGERLTPSQRQEFVKAAGDLYGKVETKMKGVNDRYGSLAGQYGIDPSQVVAPLPTYEPLDLTGGASSEPKAGGPPAGISQEEWDLATPEERALWQ